jgi:hypothetical protein
VFQAAAQDAPARHLDDPQTGESGRHGGTGIGANDPGGRRRLGDRGGDRGLRQVEQPARARQPGDLPGEAVVVDRHRRRARRGADGPDAGVAAEALRRAPEVGPVALRDGTRTRSLPGIRCGTVARGRSCPMPVLNSPKTPPSGLPARPTVDPPPRTAPSA